MLTEPNVRQTIGGRVFLHDLKCVWRGSVKNRVKKMEQFCYEKHVSDHWVPKNFANIKRFEEFVSQHFTWQDSDSSPDLGHSLGEIDQIDHSTVKKILAPLRIL